MGCIKFIVKHILFVINLIFTILGLLIIGAGSYLLYYVQHHDVKNDLKDLPLNVEQFLKYVDYFLIGVIVFGSVIFLISFCGCCGSISEKKGLLIPYAVIMFVLFCASLYLVISKDNFMGKIKTYVKTRGDKTFNSDKNPIEDTVINVIQFSFKCCGREGPDFYEEPEIKEKISSFYDINAFSHQTFVSPSCCSTFDKDAALKGGNQRKTYLKKIECKKEDAYKTGCIPKINGYIDQVGKYYIIATISVAIVEIMGMLFAIYMCVQISKKKWTSQRERCYRRA